jgi:hypothetical protein
MSEWRNDARTGSRRSPRVWRDATTLSWLKPCKPGTWSADPSPSRTSTTRRVLAQWGSGQGGAQQGHLRQLLGHVRPPVGTQDAGLRHHAGRGAAEEQQYRVPHVWTHGKGEPPEPSGFRMRRVWPRRACGHSGCENSLGPGQTRACPRTGDRIARCGHREVRSRKREPTMDRVSGPVGIPVLQDPEDVNEYRFRP